MGRDRELFINLVLSNIISVPFRLGTGDIVDPDDNLARQSDVVIEYSNTLSFPNIYPSAARLYLAESVCAVIEVKSTISVQWKSVLESATQLNKLTRSTGAVAFVGNHPTEKVPLFAIGYTGWDSIKTARTNLDQANANGLIVSGILQIDPCFYVGDGKFKQHSFDGPAGLFGFLLSVEQLTSDVVSSKPPFMHYVK